MFPLWRYSSVVGAASVHSLWRNRQGQQVFPLLAAPAEAASSVCFPDVSVLAGSSCDPWPGAAHCELGDGEGSASARLLSRLLGVLRASILRVVLELVLRACILHTRAIPPLAA